MGDKKIREYRGGAAETKMLLRFERETFDTQECYWGHHLLKMMHRHPSRLLYVCNDEKVEIHAFVLYWMLDVHPRPAVCVAKLGVHPSQRRRGLALRLMREVLRRAREEHGADSVFLHTAFDNMAALALYTRLGFVSELVVPHYYGRNRHALRLRRPSDAEP